MAFAQLDDGFPDHPKIAGLSDAAFRLHVVGIIHCSRMLTDGLIDADDVPRLVRKYKRAALNELCDRGIWRSINDGTAYEVHDYLQWNPSREKVIVRKEKARKRKENWDAQHRDQAD